MAKLRSIGSALTGAVTAAGMMYYFDATSGRGRRARLGQRSLSVTRQLGSRVRAAGVDLAHRLGGLGARAVAGLRPGRPPPQILIERVRACLGRVVSHPGAIRVSVLRPQRVVLRGAVLAWEHEPLRRAVAAVSGVGEVVDELSVYESAEHVAALQGGAARPLRQPGLPQRWSPATRMLLGLAGGGLLFGGSRRRDAWGAIGAAAGGVLLLRSVINVPLRQVARPRRQRIEVRRTMRVLAPVERVFAMLCDDGRLPRYLPGLTEVRRRADGATHWIMVGAPGAPIEWDAVITQVNPNRLLAWRTVRGSPVSHWGMLRFEPDGGGGTRLELYLCYTPPAGAVGEALAQLLGTGPDSQLDHELSQLKWLLENAPPSQDNYGVAVQQSVDLAGDAT